MPAGLTALPASAPVNPVPPELPVRVLGKTGLKIPLISMGAGNTSASGFVRSAYEAGVKMFFSATYYGEGNNERLVGEGLRGLARDSFIIGTAVPPDGLDNRTGKFIKPFDAQAYIKKTEESLKRFGLEYIDIFLFPYAGKREMVMNDNVLNALRQLKQQGKTKFVGIASHSDTVEALNAAADSGVYDVAMIAYNFKTTGQEQLNAAIDKAAAAGIGIVAMKTTAGAFDRKGGKPLNTDAAFKWVLQNRNIASIVSGMSSFEELQKNLAMIKDLKMSDQEKKDLEMASLGSPEGLYCQQCGNCIPQCPRELDIPAVMRSYMYAYGYRNTTQAWHTLAQTSITSAACSSCSECSIKCPSGFDVRKKVMDIARLRDVPSDLLPPSLA